MPFTRNPRRLAQVACLTLLASLASGSVMPGAVGASDSLIGLWHLDGNAQDSSGNSHDGTINGAIPTTGVSGQAYSFDGSAGISVGNLDFSSGQYTVNIWFRTRVPAVSEDWRMMIAKTNIPAGDQTFELAIGDGRDNGAGNAPFFLVWDNGSGPVNIASPAGLNTRDGNWHMATATYIFGDQRLYVDGCLVGTSAYAGPLPIISDDVVIGGVNGFGPYHHPWKGDLDEVSIHGRPLDPREILALWKLHGGATTCLGENGLPVAGNDTASTAEETALLITGAALLANDTDPDGDSLTITGVSPSATTYGSLSLAHGSVTYIPGPNYNGLASFTYTISDGNGGTAAASVDVVVRPVNDPPVCTAVRPDASQLWPPDHSLRPVTLSGATDVDGDSVTIAVTRVTQDEPLNGQGDGDTAPDAQLGSVSNQVSLRAERSGKGDGRIYRVSFAGADPSGGLCSGMVTVGVPKSQGGASAIPIASPLVVDSLGS